MSAFLEHETAALRRIADKAIASPEAFGPSFPGRFVALRAQDFHYTIRHLGAGLELEIDTCSAFLAPLLALRDLEPDEATFEALLITFESSQATRQSYLELRSVARSVLAGGAIRLADGQVRNFRREALACAAIS